MKLYNKIALKQDHRNDVREIGGNKSKAVDNFLYLYKQNLVNLNDPDNKDGKRNRKSKKRRTHRRKTLKKID